MSPRFTKVPSGTTEISVEAPPAESRWPRTPTATFSSWHSMTVRFALSTRPLAIKVGESVARRTPVVSY